MLVDIVESADQDLVYLLRDLFSIFFDVAHLGHDTLQLLLDHVLLFGQ